MDNWEQRLNEIIANGTPNQAETARWKMGYKTGLRVEQKRILDILEYYQVLYWDDTKKVWLEMSSGKPIYGLDSREEDWEIHKESRKNQEALLRAAKQNNGHKYANA
jgi:hypothetical protein